jgi:uncharacterized protein (TIGR00255 family)
MTGFGEGVQHSERGTVSVELRSVNNRYLKINSKLPESHAKFEADIERSIRENVSRGTVSLTLRVHYTAGVQSHRINTPLLESYLSQLRPIVTDPSPLLGSLLLLPGVVEDSIDSDDSELDGPAILEALSRALSHFDGMREREGAAMREELIGHCDAIDRLVESVADRAPLATTAFRDRLVERVNDLLKQQGVTVTPGDLIREVSIYAERSDVAEELARLRSHVGQFRSTMNKSEACGRKLDFLSQEMFRECNTLGSKSGDPLISEAALELKSIVERIREMIANVE